MATLIRDCRIEPRRLRPVLPTMENHDVGDPDEDWPHNVISTGTVAYSCGALYRPGDIKPVHKHLPAELKLCEKLANEAASFMQGIPLGMGSESNDKLLPFFVTASEGMEIPEEITEGVVRRAFGGSIHPNAQLVIEPLTEGTSWWQSVSSHCEDHPQWLEKWKRTMQWFQDREELIGPVFIQIGGRDNPDLPGTVFPRLILAQTEEGSLVGLYGFVVHSG